MSHSYSVVTSKHSFIPGTGKFHNCLYVFQIFSLKNFSSFHIEKYVKNFEVLTLVENVIVLSNFRRNKTIITLLIKDVNENRIHYLDSNINSYQHTNFHWKIYFTFLSKNHFYLHSFSYRMCSIVICYLRKYYLIKYHSVPVPSPNIFITISL